MNCSDGAYSPVRNSNVPPFAVRCDGRIQVFVHTGGEDQHPGIPHLIHDSLCERPATGEPLLAVIAHPLLIEIDDVLAHRRPFFTCG